MHRSSRKGRPQVVHMRMRWRTKSALLSWPPFSPRNRFLWKWYYRKFSLPPCPRKTARGFVDMRLTNFLTLLPLFRSSFASVIAPETGQTHARSPGRISFFSFLFHSTSSTALVDFRAEQVAFFFPFRLPCLAQSDAHSLLFFFCFFFVFLALSLLQSAEEEDEDEEFWILILLLLCCVSLRDFLWFSKAEGKSWFRDRLWESAAVCVKRSVTSYGGKDVQVHHYRWRRCRSKWSLLGWI